MASLPFRIRDLIRGLEEVRRKLEGDVRILVAGPPGAPKEELRKLLAAGAGSRAQVRLRDLTGEERPREAARDFGGGLSVLLFDARQPVPGWAVDLVLSLRFAGKVFVPVVGIVDGGAGDGETAKELARLCGRPPEGVAAVSLPDGDGLDRLLKMCVEAAQDHAIALGANFPAFRRPAARQRIERTARQNALIGAVAFIPGSDMPALTANQIKLVLELAAIYGEELGFERGKELLAVVGGGYTLRAVARQALGVVPVAGWAIKGAFAYAGTLALGRLAMEYFERQSRGRRPGAAQ